MFNCGCFYFAHSMRKGLYKVNFKNKQRIKKKYAFYLISHIPQPLIKIIIGYLPKIQLQQSRLSMKHIWDRHSGVLLNSFHSTGRTGPSPSLSRFQQLLNQTA